MWSGSSIEMNDSVNSSLMKSSTGRRHIFTIDGPNMLPSSNTSISSVNRISEETNKPQFLKDNSRDFK